MFEIYTSQVRLLLRVLPFVAEEGTFALKGGTAINLFIRDLPRLSVDIDLTYLPFDNRNTALKNISGSLKRIKTRIEDKIPDINVNTVAQEQGNDAKLICSSSQGAQVKIEANTTMRGHLFEPRILSCSGKVMDTFEAFAEIKILSHAELYGGKICAALDRQHPRDLFDVYYLLENEGMTAELKTGFIAALLSHPRPINEVLNPNLLDQRDLYERMFEGMTFEPFSYEDFETTRVRLIGEIKKTLTSENKEFLLDFKSGTPDWNLIEVPRLKDLPAVKWKLLNINKLKATNPEKHQQQYKILQEKLY